jgi:hypothetical protein
MREFGHDWIDILKVIYQCPGPGILSQLLYSQVELKGSEFATLLAIIADNHDEPLPFGQLAIKVHIGLSDRTSSSSK